MHILPLVLKPALAAAFAVMSTAATIAGDWPAWRGANGSGVSRETQLPLRWSTNENVRWRAPLPAPGNSTPIVWGDRVFITQSIENRRTVLCFDRRDGKLLWQQGPTWADKEPTHESNPPCSPSPVTDGDRVVAWFGSAGVYCFDLDGRELWRRDLGRQTHVWGYASSPIVYRELCMLNFGPGPRSFLIALDKKSGATVWQFDVPALPLTAKWRDFGGVDRPGDPTVSETAGSWATPLIVPAAGHDELVVAFAMRVMAFAPQTGEQLWTCDGPNIGVYSSPYYGDGIVGLTASGPTNTALAVRPGGRGDVTSTHRLWLNKPGQSQTCIGAGVIHQKHIYQFNMMGFAECVDLNTGRTIWSERLIGSGARNSSWSCPLLAGDRLYMANQNADVFVLRASPTFECLATNSIGGESMNASLAVSDAAIYLRTAKNLWCIAPPPKSR